MSKRYALLDRDGTIIVEKGYLNSVEGLELLPGAIEGLQLLAAKGFGLVVITNQSGIARGLVSLESVEAIHAELTARLATVGVHIEGIYYCPHGPTDACLCRKPRTELAERAAAALGFNPSECLVIGDKPSDIELGHNLNARAILVRTGYGSQHEAPEVAADLLAAAHMA